MIINDCVLDLKRYWAPYGSVAPPLGWADDSRYGNDGVDTAMTWVQLPSGLWVKSFNGAASVVTIADTGYGVTDYITILAWINTTQITDRSTIYADADISFECNDVGASVSDGALGIAELGVGNPVRTNDNVVVPNTWYHVAYTKNGAGANKNNVYLNGVALAFVNDAAWTMTPNGTKYIGARGGASQWFSGYMGPLQVYNYALTPDQINAKFASERHWFDGA